MEQNVWRELGRKNLSGYQVVVLLPLLDDKKVDLEMSDNKLIFNIKTLRLRKGKEIEFKMFIGIMNL